MKNCYITAVFILVILQAFAFSNTTADYQYLSPKPGSTDISVQANLLIRFAHLPVENLKNPGAFIRVTGAQGRQYEGVTKIASDGRTIIFKPNNFFQPGETISVTLNPQSHSLSTQEFSYHFTTSVFEQKPVQEPEAFLRKKTIESRAPVLGKPTLLSNGVVLPSDFPQLMVANYSTPDSGYIFMNNWDDGTPYNVIFDNDGMPVWYNRTLDRRRDFKVQKNGQLTMLVRTGYPFGMGFIAMDNTYTVVDSFYAVNGYSTDEHELQVLENGNYLLIGIRSSRVDMSQYVEGGKERATVYTSVLQEFTPDGELVLLWDPWDHINIADTYVPDESDIYSSSIRFPHMNSIEVDKNDGNIVISMRHASEVCKIDRQTGEFIWRLGGEKNQFTFINDELNGFENQHDARVVAPNHITLFDNGNEHNPSVSRACEYELDTENMTATLVWEYRYDPDIYSHWMGNVQRLPNGNTLINWANSGLPKLTEVTPDGQKVMEAEWARHGNTYRVFRFPWKGIAKRPNLIVEAHKENVLLIFNKFGDDNVDYYKIYAGTSEHPTTAMDTSRTPYKSLLDFENETRYYFRVTAVDKDGVESEFSDEKHTLVNFIEPGQNIIPNGDFEEKKRHWYFGASAPASATMDIEDGVAHIKINQASDDSWSIQVVQLDLEVLQGELYAFEFDVWADEDRLMEAVVLKSMEPFTDYSKAGFISLKTRRQHYTFNFTMTEPSDFTSALAFFLGTDDADVYIDNVQLKRIVAAVEETPTLTPTEFNLAANYPNPFNPATTIDYSIAQTGHVTVQVYNLLGKLVQTLVDEPQHIGDYQIRFDGVDKSTGVYIYKLIVKNVEGQILYENIRKMMMIK